MTVTTSLGADPSITCATFIGDEESEAEQCSNLSRFVVSRSDGDMSYGINGGSEEACEEHLAEAVTGMVGGDEHVTAIVAIRWDAAEPSPREAGQ